MLQDPQLKIKEPHSIRWLSLKIAVETVFKTYPSVVVALAEIGQSNLTASGLHKYFVKEKTALLTAFMLDVHEKISIFTQQLQKENIVFSELKPLFEASIAGVKSLYSGGEHYTSMKSILDEGEGNIKGVQLSNHNAERQDLLKLMKKYIDRLCLHMSDRLTENNGNIVTDFGAILEPKLFNDDLADNAVDELEEFYGSQKVSEVGNRDFIEY